MEGGKRLVIFDLDYTLFKKNSCLSFYLYLCKMGVFPRSTLFPALIYFSAYRFFLFSSEGLHRKIFQQFLKGRPSSSFLALADEFWEQEWKASLHPLVLSRLYQAQDRGDHVLLLSQAPAFLVRPLAKKLGVDGCRGSEYILDKEGQFYEILSMVSGANKAIYAKAKAEDLGIPLITAYSDCMSDLPLLELADQPICVAPDKRLRAICKKKNWEIIEP